MNKLNRELMLALDTIDSLIAIKNLDGVYTYTNKAVDDFYKEKYTSIIGKSYLEIYPPSEQKIVRELDQEVIIEKKTINKTIKVLTDKGYIFVDSSRAPIWNENGEITGVISVSKNVTEREEAKLKLAEINEKYYQLAYTDELTQIGNRRKFYEDFLSYNANKECTLIIIDLNNFKKINDLYGHNKGDQALREFAQALQEVSHKNKGTAYRLGGDEFIVLYPTSTVSFECYIEELDYKLQSFHKDVSVSYGDIVVGRDQTKDQAYRDLCIKRADDILYEYKILKKS